MSLDRYLGTRVRKTVATLFGIMALLANDTAIGQPSGQWETLSREGFTRRFDFAFAAFDGKIYTFGGRLWTGSENIVYDVIEVYDPTSNSWSTITPNGTPAKRLTHTATVADGKIYLIGGYKDRFGANTDLIEVFDPVTNEITAVAPSGDAIIRSSAHTAETLDGKIYLFGGFATPEANSQKVAVFDPRANTSHIVTPLGDQFAVRGYHASAAMNNKIYTLGGLYDVSVFDVIEEFDPTISTLRILDVRLPVPLHYHSAVVLNNLMYIVDGATTIGGNPSRHLYAFDPSAAAENAIQQVSTRGTYVSSRGAAVVLDGRIYQLPGNNAQVPMQVFTPDVQSFVPPKLDGDVVVTPVNERGIYRVCAGEEVRSVDVFDIRGQRIQSTKAPGSEAVIDLVERSTGIYLVRVVTASDVRTVRVIR